MLRAAPRAPPRFSAALSAPTYRLHDTTGEDRGLIEHPAPNVEPGDVVMLPHRREALVNGAC